MSEKYMTYKYPNESFSGCDMTASIVYSWEEDDNKDKKKRKFASHTLGEIQTISYSIHMEKSPVRSIGNVNAKDYVMGQRTIAGSLVFAVFNKHFAKQMMEENNRLFKAGKMFLVDELPPFNIVISLANEYGLRSKLVIYGVRLLNEGQVMSINDVYTENTYQFMATDLEYLNDELAYESRSNHSQFFKLKDEYLHRGNDTLPSASNRVKIHYYDPNNDKIEKIKLNVSTIDATRNNKNGKAVFSLYPIQSEGTLKITNSKNEVITIPVNGSNSYSILLSPDMYNVIFKKPNPDTWSCNAKDFDIKEFIDIYTTKKYAPIIDLLTDTSVTVYSNEPTHSHVGLKRGDVATYYLLKNRRVKITGLERDTQYIIFTCNGENTLTSPEIKIKTFNAFNKPFNNFRKMVECNLGLLLYKDLNRYYKIINEAEKSATNSNLFQSPTDFIIKLKQRYETELKNLDPNDMEYSDKFAELKHNIYACGELIYISTKDTNNIMKIINKEAAIPCPKIHVNDSLDNIFEFKNDINEAEFYKIYRNNIPQFADLITSNMFDIIDGYENSFLYIGRSGLNHYVQAVRSGVRSPKIEFYSLTAKEKEKRLSENKPVITKQEQLKLDLGIKDELGKNINNDILNRAFMRKVKQIDTPKILDVNVNSVKDDFIEVETVINKITNNEIEENFYLAVAQKNDLVNNDFIYKKKFSNKENEIKLNDIDYALEKDNNYAIWIEDKDFNQISNATTFKMNKEDDINNRSIFEYENSYIVNDIKNRIKDIVPELILDMFTSEIENNEEITKTNIIDKTLEFILYNGMGQITTIKCLKAIKKYIGFIGESDNIINSPHYQKNILTFNSLKDCNTIMLEVSDSNINYRIENSKVGINSFQINKACDFILVLNATQDLKFKSDIVYIDTLENRMEVL